MYRNVIDLFNRYARINQVVTGYYSDSRIAQDVFEEHAHDVVESLRKASEQATASTEEVTNGLAEFFMRGYREMMSLDISDDEDVDAFIL